MIAAGDATLALWSVEPDGDPAVAVLRAACCALAVQKRLDGLEVTAGVRLRQRLAITAGKVWMAGVGGVEGRWESVLLGEPLAQIGTALQRASQGDVVCSLSAWSLVASTCRGEPCGDGCVRLDHVHDERPPRPLPPLAVPASAEAALRAYVPRSMQSRIDAGQTAWMAEFRRVTVLFIHVHGFERSGPDDLQRLHQAMGAIQKAVYRYGGSVNQVIVDDKGTTAIAAWGLALHRHEDDALRGTLAALSIAEQLGRQGLKMAAGLTTGRIFTGRRGGEARLEFALIGDTVNLAARLMQAAGEGVLTDQTTREMAGKRVHFGTLGQIEIQGRSGRVKVFEPLHEAKRRSIPHREMIGRIAERQRLTRVLEDLRLGKSGVAVVEGEAGIGKSRLLAEFLDLVRESGLLSVEVSGDALEQGVAFGAWRPVFRQILGFPAATAPGRTDTGFAAAVRSRLEALLGDDPRWRNRLPLLNPVLPLHLPETRITAALTAQSRAEITSELMGETLRRAYVEYDGDLSVPPPVAFRKLGIRSFPLLADKSRLEAVCKKFLNDPIAGSGVEFKPLLPLVYMQVATYGYMASEVPEFHRMGYFTENELSFNILVGKTAEKNGTRRLEEIGFFLPYVIVDNSWAMVTGREVFGFPKAYGWFDIPEDLQHPYPTTVRAPVFPKYSPQTLLTPETLVEAKKNGLWEDRAELEPGFQILGGIDKILEKANLGPLEASVKDLIDKVISTEKIGMVQLKQLRGFLEPSRACYQAVTVSHMEMTELRGQGLLQSAVIDLVPYDSLPIARALGLMPKGVRTFVPILPYWIDFDCTVTAESIVARPSSA